MNIFSWFKKPKTPIKLPIPGETWGLRDESPWPKSGYTAIILDVKEGWVRYEMNPLFPDERKPLKSFLDCYSFIK